MNRLLTSVSVLALLGAASAQVGTGYGFTQTTGTYVPIVGGTQLGVATVANPLDDVSFPVTLPFSFVFDNNPQTAINVQTNGHLSFGSTAPGTTYTPLSSTIVVPGFVAASGRDLQGGYLFAGNRTLGSDQLTNVSAVGPMQIGDVITGTGIATGTTILAIAGNVITMSLVATATSTGTGVQAFGPWSEMRYETLGTSPNQVFVVQWSNFRRFTSSTLSTSGGLILNFQIRLYETTNVIECVYGNCTPGTTTLTTTHQVGLRGPTNAFPANVNNRLNVKGTSDWATSTPGTLNTSGEVFNNTAPANVIPNGLTYTWTPALIATNIPYGAGCYDVAKDSFYEYFATSTAAQTALAANSMVLSPTANGYVATWGGGTYVAPTLLALPLAVGDDGEVSQALSTGFPTPLSGSFTNIMVHGNGIISLGTLGQTFTGNNYTPSAAAFLVAARTAFWTWHDFNSAETLSGLVKYEEALDGNSDLIAYVTWDDVESYASPEVVNRSTIQFQLTLTGSNAGRVVYVWPVVDGNASSTFGSGYLVGYSTGGPNLDPGSITLSTALPIVTSPDVLALALSAAPAPVLGNTVVYTTSNIPVSTVASAQVISLGQVNPGSTIPGAPGCLQYVDLSLSATILLTVGSPAPSSATFSLSVPNDAGLIGLPLFNQSAALVPGVNPLEVITSNGVKSTVSNL